MDSRKIVFQETGIVTLGVSLCSAAMAGVFALMRLFDLSVLLGALVGTVLTVLNFFVMAICASLAADKAAAGDVNGGKSLISWSQTGRYAVLALLLTPALSVSAVGGGTATVTSPSEAARGDTITFTVEIGGQEVENESSFDQGKDDNGKYIEIDGVKLYKK
jgi:hypothetical protein